MSTDAGPQCRTGSLGEDPVHDSSPRESTFLFADLVGFTALTEELGDEHAANLATAFCSELNRHLPADAEDVKMLGDSCLVRVGSPAEAIDLGLKLTGGLAPHYGFPDVRVGMHTGTAVRRGGDWFGSGVNIAARVVALSHPGEVLLSETTRAAAQGTTNVSLQDLGEHGLRNVARSLRLYRALPPG